MAAVAEALRLMTVAEFDRAGRAGVYRPEEKLELIEGEVFRKMSPQESEHCTGVRAVEEALRLVFGGNHDVRTQMPLVFGSYSKHEPDIAVRPAQIPIHASGSQQLNLVFDEAVP